MAASLGAPRCLRPPGISGKGGRQDVARGRCYPRRWGDVRCSFESLLMREAWNPRIHSVELDHKSVKA